MYYLRTLFDDVMESTARTYMSSFGKFIEYLTGNNPYTAAGISWNKAQIVNRKFIFREQWEKLKAVAEPDEMLILMLGAGLGLRRAEIAGLRLDDIVGDEITIRGKGHGPNGKPAVMKMPGKLKDALGPTSRSARGSSTNTATTRRGTCWSGASPTPASPCPRTPSETWCTASARRPESASPPTA